MPNCLDGACVTKTVKKNKKNKKIKELNVSIYFFSH